MSDVPERDPHHERLKQIDPAQLAAHDSLTQVLKMLAIRAGEHGLDPALVGSALFNALVGWWRVILGYEREKIESEIIRCCKETWSAENERQT